MVICQPANAAAPCAVGTGIVQSASADSLPPPPPPSPLPLLPLLPICRCMRCGVLSQVSSKLRSAAYKSEAACNLRLVYSPQCTTGMAASQEFWVLHEEAYCRGKEVEAVAGGVAKGLVEGAQGFLPRCQALRQQGPLGAGSLQRCHCFSWPRLRRMPPAHQGGLPSFLHSKINDRHHHFDHVTTISPSHCLFSISSFNVYWQCMIISTPSTPSPNCGHDMPDPNPPAGDSPQAT